MNNMAYYIETIHPQSILRNTVQFLDDKNGAMNKLKETCYSHRDNLNTAFVRLVERKKETWDSVVIAILVDNGKITQVYGRGRTNEND